MCTVHNTVGSLTTIKSHLHGHGITEFKSLQQVLSFQKNYASARQQIIADAEKAIETEQTNLTRRIDELNHVIELEKNATAAALQQDISTLQSQIQRVLNEQPKSSWKKFVHFFRVYFLQNKIRRLEATLPFRISNSVRSLVKDNEKNEERYHFISTQFQEAVAEYSTAEMNALDRKKAIIDEINAYIYGAIGEQKVVKELEQLSDDYVLINDFCMSFRPPIYNQNENERIHSVQIDHLLIAPSGIFLIETKNWSEASLQNISLHSPVAQLKRASFAIFTLVNKWTASQSLRSHHWGIRKIPVRNVVALINKKPQEEFQYVKVLHLNELLNYIKYFPPIFTRRETENIANDLLRLIESGK
jgi:hypothetical protein